MPHVNTFKAACHSERVNFFQGLLKCNHYEPHFYENAMDF